MREMKNRVEYENAVDEMPTVIEAEQKDVGDMVSRSYLLSEYDRQHEGPPGGARKIIEEAPSIETEIIFCKDCRHNGSFDTDCPIKWGKTDSDFCSRAERRADG